MPYTTVSLTISDTITVGENAPVKVSGKIISEPVSPEWEKFMVALWYVDGPSDSITFIDKQGKSFSLSKGVALAIAILGRNVGLTLELEGYIKVDKTGEYTISGIAGAILSDGSYYIDSEDRRKVKAVSPTEKPGVPTAPIPEIPSYWWIIAGAGALIAIIGVIGIVAYQEQQREMMLMMAMLR
jgi:hypothetical protein